MSKFVDYASGPYHVTFKLRGTPESIELFHALVRRCESSWPWGPSMFQGNSAYSYIHTRQIPACSKCKGVIINSPRIAPQDIKAAAVQAKVNIKIFHYAQGEKCTGEGHGTTMNHRELVSMKNSPLLYSAKPKRIRIHKGEVFVEPQPVSKHAIIDAIAFAASEGSVDDEDGGTETTVPRLTDDGVTIQ